MTLTLEQIETKKREIRRLKGEISDIAILKTTLGRCKVQGIVRNTNKGTIKIMEVNLENWRNEGLKALETKQRLNREEMSKLANEITLNMEIKEK